MKTCTQMFMAALFILAQMKKNKNKDKKQMSTNGWINSNTSAKWNTTKQPKVMNLDDKITWMNLKNNELSKWNYIKGVYTEFHSHELKKKKKTNLMCGGWHKGS